MDLRIGRLDRGWIAQVLLFHHFWILAVLGFAVLSIAVVVAIPLGVEEAIDREGSTGRDSS
jgi:hypothetical protein